MSDPKKPSFKDASAGKSRNLLSELLAMLMQNKKYWLLPIFLVLLVFGLLLILGGGSIAPFIYSLF